MLITSLIQTFEVTVDRNYFLWGYLVFSLLWSILEIRILNELSQNQRNYLWLSGWFRPHLSFSFIIMHLYMLSTRVG